MYSKTLQHQYDACKIRSLNFRGGVVWQLIFEAPSRVQAEAFARLRAPGAASALSG
jgi:hypothetical protein